MHSPNFRPSTLYRSLCFLFLFYYESTSFDFDPDNTTNFIFSGDAFMFNDRYIRLTQDLGVRKSSEGMVLYNKPARLRCNGSQTYPASFDASISFSISDFKAVKHLNLMFARDDKATSGNVIVADLVTFMDNNFKDANGNYVGSDPKIVDNFDLMSHVNLEKGRIVTVWMGYSGITGEFNMYVSNGKTRPVSTKPKSPVLSVTRNICPHVIEHMYVGLSGSTQGITEADSIFKWHFNSYCDEPDTKPGSDLPSQPPPTNSIDRNLFKCRQKKCKVIEVVVSFILGSGTVITISIKLYGCWKRGRIPITIECTNIACCCSGNAP